MNTDALAFSLLHLSLRANENFNVCCYQEIMNLECLTEFWWSPIFTTKAAFLELVSCETSNLNPSCAFDSSDDSSELPLL